MIQDYSRLFRILDVRIDSEINNYMGKIGITASILLAVMPTMFARRQMVLAGALAGIGKRSIDKHLVGMMRAGLIVRVGNGLYKKKEE